MGQVHFCLFFSMFLKVFIYRDSSTSSSRSLLPIDFSMILFVLEENEGIPSIGTKMRVCEVLEENEGIPSIGRKMRVCQVLKENEGIPSIGTKMRVCEVLEENEVPSI